MGSCTQAFGQLLDLWSFFLGLRMGRYWSMIYRCVCTYVLHVYFKMCISVATHMCVYIHGVDGTGWGGWYRLGMFRCLYMSPYIV